MNTIELTPAELELIKLQREKKELEERELAAKKQARLEKDIEEEKRRMISDLMKVEKYNKFMEAGYNKLNQAHPGLYTLT